jgi:hypothetical protein
MALVRSFAFAGLAILVSGAPLGAADGVLIVTEMNSAGMAMTSRMQLEPMRMRAEMGMPGLGQQVVIFDGAKDVLYIIDSSRKSYIEMTREGLEKLSAQMRVMLESMKGMLATLPAEQRAPLEAMMAAPGSPEAQALKPMYKRAGAGKSRAWTCDIYQVFQGGAAVGEICTVQPAALGLRPADFAVVNRMSELASAMAPQVAGQMMQFGEPAKDGFSGLAVKSSMTMMGTTATSEIVSVSRETFADSLFVVPAGYQQQPFDLGMMGR